MSLHDTIISSKVSKKSRYFKKNFILLKIYHFSKSILNLQSGVYFQENKKTLSAFRTTKRVYYKI